MNGRSNKSDVIPREVKPSPALQGLQEMGTAIRVDGSGRLAFADVDQVSLAFESGHSAMSLGTGLPHPYSRSNMDIEVQSGNGP